MKPIELLLLITFGFWVACIYGAFTLVLSDESFELIALPIGLLAITFLYILRKEKSV
jgi:hypothetical protein